MNAHEFFQNVVRRNYEEFSGCPKDLRLLWNVVVSMNTVAEYIALDQLGYSPVSREELDRKAHHIREQFSELSDLKFCAEAFKHVRKIKDDRGSEFTTVATSTSVSPDDQTSWKIERYDLVSVLRRAFAALQEIPELN